jgi:sensor histidine kinase regulating citrate/malate metabolism
LSVAAEQSFAKQIRKLIVVTCAIAVVLTTIACWAVLQYLMRSTAHERADTLANLLASNAPAVLALKDQPRASELLRSAASARRRPSDR